MSVSYHMENTANLNRINQATFERADVVKYYQHVDELLPAERALFQRLESSIRNSRVLDLGVGGGRTTAALLNLTDDYTGVDYVSEFVEETGKRFPEARIMWGDARKLDGLEDQSFDFVLFSYNGLDCVSHEGRLEVLRAVHRVLRPGGVFMFSSHNRDYEFFNKLPWQRKIVFRRDYLIFLLHCLYHFPKHLKMRKLETYAEDFAIINDGDHRFSLLLYYISIGKQKGQLEAAGFGQVEAFNEAGDLVDADTDSHWIHYVARKV